MFDFTKDDGPASKCYFTHSLLPRYIDPAHPPLKKKPFSTFQAQPFSHTLDLILPEELYEVIQQQLEGDLGTLRYARVFMKLEEILSGDFFTDYIKKGNIMMLSEGRPKVDNVFSLYEGVLRLELDRPTYERCGLSGKPIEDGGRKHQKARYVIEYNLRAPNMLHGKKGFNRLIWACKNVLNNSLTWLFHDFYPPLEGKEPPILAHAPFVKTIKPSPTILSDILVPTLPDLPALYDQEDSLDLLEYLHMISLDSPRIRANDRAEPYISRYQVPSLTSDAEAITMKTMVRVRWRGFIPPSFVRELYLSVRKGFGEVKGGDEGWFAMTGKGFEGYGGCWTVMQMEGRDTLVWEYE